MALLAPWTRQPPPPPSLRVSLEGAPALCLPRTFRALPRPALLPVIHALGTRFHPEKQVPVSGCQSPARLGAAAATLTCSPAVTSRPRPPGRLLPFGSSKEHLASEGKSSEEAAGHRSPRVITG